MNDKITLTVKIDRNIHKQLQQMAHQYSLERKDNITVSDLVREALEKVYFKKR